MSELYKLFEQHPFWWGSIILVLGILFMDYIYTGYINKAKIRLEEKKIENNKERNTRTEEGAG
jgi:hypothetical protein